MPPSSTINWPTNLPSPRIDSFQEAEAQLTIASQTDIGPPKVRRRATAGIRVIQLSYLMSTTQLETFKQFYRAVTNFGVLPYNMIHPVTRTSVVVQFRSDETPTWTAASANLWNVTFAVYELV